MTEVIPINDAAQTPDYLLRKIHDECDDFKCLVVLAITKEGNARIYRTALTHPDLSYLSHLLQASVIDEFCIEGE
jgi:hypothetical protein